MTHFPVGVVLVSMVLACDSGASTARKPTPVEMCKVEETELERFSLEQSVDAFDLGARLVRLSDGEGHVEAKPIAPRKLPAGESSSAVANSGRVEKAEVPWVKAPTKLVYVQADREPLVIADDIMEDAFAVSADQQFVLAVTVSGRVRVWYAPKARLLIDGASTTLPKFIFDTSGNRFLYTRGAESGVILASADLPRAAKNVACTGP